MGLMPLPESWRASFTAWGLLLPALCLISVSVLIPAVMALVMSFSATGLDVSEPIRFVGLANLRRLLTDPMVRQVLVTTFFYLVGVVPPIVFGALGLAVLVNRSLPGIHWLRGALYTPVLVSIVVGAIAFRWLYAENGLINGWLATCDLFSANECYSRSPISIIDDNRKGGFRKNGWGRVTDSLHLSARL